MGRSAQYSSKEERDSSIKSELKQLSEVVAAKNKLVKDTEGEIEQLDTQINDKTTLRTEKEEKLNQIKQTLDDQMKTCTKLRNQRDSLANERKFVFHFSTFRNVILISDCFAEQKGKMERRC